MNEDLLNVVGNFIETELDYVEKSNNEIKQLQNQVEKLTQENNDLEERVIHQDNKIKRLQSVIDKAVKYIEKHTELAPFNDDGEGGGLLLCDYDVANVLEILRSKEC